MGQGRPRRKWCLEPAGAPGGQWGGAALPSLAQPQRPQTWAPRSPRGSSGPKYGAGLARGWYEPVPGARKGVQILLCPLGSYRTELQKASQPPPTGTTTTHRGRHRLTLCPTLESLLWEKGGSLAPLEAAHGPTDNPPCQEVAEEPFGLLPGSPGLRALAGTKCSEAGGGEGVVGRARQGQLLTGAGGPGRPVA